MKAEKIYDVLESQYRSAIKDLIEYYERRMNEGDNFNTFFEK